MEIVKAVQQMELVQKEKDTRREVRSCDLSRRQMTTILVIDFVVFSMMLTCIHRNLLL
jgi:hypothetical protein